MCGHESVHTFFFVHKDKIISKKAVKWQKMSTFVGENNKRLRVIDLKSNCFNVICEISTIEIDKNNESRLF